MSDLRTAAQQALEALECGQHTLKQISEYQWESRGQLAMDALRAALADGDKLSPGEPVQEPVAWWHRKSDTFTSGNLVSKFDEWTPLYPAPPQRKENT